MRWIPDEWRSFVVLAEELHFRKASERLFISQPALSKQIRRLEEEIGARLFVRNRRRVVLTEVGKGLVPLTHELLQRSRDVFSRARDIIEGRAGTLRIGYGTATVTRNLPKALQQFRESQKTVQLNLSYMKRPAQISALLNDKLDIGFLRLPVGEPSLESLQLFHERLVLAIPRSIPYKTAEGLICLRDRPWILFTIFGSAAFHVTAKFEDALSNARHRENVLAVFRRAGFAPSVLHGASDFFTVLNLVAAGWGMSLMPRFATQIKVPGVKYIELNMPEAEWSGGVVWKRGSEKRNLIARFVAIVSDVFSRMHTEKSKARI